MLNWILLAAWIGIIFFFGTGMWGRAQTQGWIDRANRNPRLHAFLNRHHGKLRASFHYVEFGVLTLILYGLLSAIGGHPFSTWGVWRAVAAGGMSAVAAYLDELHQLSSGTRCFRLVDYLHSCCGISLALLAIRYSAL